MGKTIVIIGIIGILLFTIQYVFCFKAKRTAIKLIPSYIAIICGLLAIAYYIGLFGNWEASPISFKYDPTLIFFGTISILFFAIQFLFCFIAKKTAIKLIPTYILLFCLLFAALLYLGVFGSPYGFSWQGILGLYLAIGSGTALVGDVIAWIIAGLKKPI